MSATTGLDWVPVDVSIASAASVSERASSGRPALIESARPFRTQHTGLPRTPRAPEATNMRLPDAGGHCLVPADPLGLDVGAHALPERAIANGRPARAGIVQLTHVRNELANTLHPSAIADQDVEDGATAVRPAHDVKQHGPPITRWLAFQGTGIAANLLNLLRTAYKLPHLHNDALRARTDQ